MFRVRPKRYAVPKAYVIGVNMAEKMQKLKNVKRPGKRNLTDKCAVADHATGIRSKNAAKR